MFPMNNEVAEYQRLTALELLRKVLVDVQDHSKNGSGCKVEDLLGGPLNNETLDTYQRKLGNADLPTYGGDTTCISIETGDGDLIVIDGGSGIRNCSKFFTNRWPADTPRQIAIFGTHEHLDHRSGLPFSQFCFVRPPFHVNIFGSYQFLYALDERYGIFTHRVGNSTHLDDPIDYRVMAASFTGTELRNFDLPLRPPDPPWAVRDVKEPYQLNKTTVRAFDVYHGTVRCLAYKIQHGSASFVFCTDHELRHGANAGDERQLQSQRADTLLTENCMDVDAAYFDGQYYRSEYDGKSSVGMVQATSRVDWGHGCIEDVVDRARKCHIKRTLIGHHDPERTWMARMEMDAFLAEQCKGQPFQIELAKSEYVLDL